MQRYLDSYRLSRPTENNRINTKTHPHMQNTYMTEGHRIQTEGVSGATSTESFLDFFSKVDDLHMVQLTQKMEKVKKTPKCIDITLRKWSQRPL